MPENVIVGVDEHSVCAEMGVEPGDVLLSINNMPIQDVFDYRYLTQEDSFDMLIRKRSGEEWLLEIEKHENEDLGISFDSGLMDEAKHCTNKCIFCFIDQLPKQMRPTLYFKDDDSRLSFLSGNYVTLTNMTDSEFNRILYYHLSPINVSVHATDPNLRMKMMGNAEAAHLMPKLKLLYDAGISMNYQVVLCKNVNDGKHMEETIRALAGFMPLAKSLSIVPTGLTKHREELLQLQLFDADDSRVVIRQVESFQTKFLKEQKTRFVYAADEFYLNAGTSCPSYKAYEDFPQLENGVGMTVLFEHEFFRALRAIKVMPRKTHVSIITGTAAYPLIERLCSEICSHDIIVDVYMIKNHFFGETITVSGLVTGRDILDELKGKELGERLLIPSNALRDGYFLDDMNLKELSIQLNTDVVEVKINGLALVQAIL